MTGRVPTPPDVAIVVATHNRATLVAETLEAVATQEAGAFEIVVVDDGSTDDTRVTVEALGDPRIRCIGREQGGISAARNTGANSTAAAALIFLDDDDRPAPGWITALSGPVLAEGAAVACAGCRLVDESGNVVQTRRPRRLGPAFLDVTASFMAGTFCVRADVFREVGGFKEGLQCSHGTELGLRLVPYCIDNQLDIVSMPDLLIDIARPVSPSGRRERNPQKLLSGVGYIIETHRHLLERDPPLLANHFAIAGVASARLGKHELARGYLSDAWRSDRLRLRHFLRRVVIAVPGLPRIVWSRF